MRPTSLAALAAVLAALSVGPAGATERDRLTIGLSQFPSNCTPTSIHGGQELRARADAAAADHLRPVWSLVCMLCTELPTFENGAP
jgi:peptide/nickel transport system substrate-binding protein